MGSGPLEAKITISLVNDALPGILQLKQGLESLSLGMYKIDQTVNNLGTRFDTMTRKMSEAKREADETRARMNALAEKMKDLAILSAKAAALGFGTRATWGFLKTGIGEAGNLELAMAQTRAEITRTGDSVEMLNSKLLKIRSTAAYVQSLTPYDLKDIVKLEKTLLQAGLPYNSVVGKNGVASSVAQLSTYMDTDPIETGRVVSRLAYSYHLKPEQYSWAADLMARTKAASLATLESFRQFGQYSAKEMSFLGVPFKEAMTIIGALANTENPERVGTSLRQYYTRATRIPWLRNQQTKELLPIDEQMAQFKKHFGNLSQAQFVMRLSKLMNIRGMDPVLTLLTGGSNDPGAYAYVKKNMEDSLGLADKMTITLDTLIRQKEVLSSTKKSLFEELFQPALNPIKETMVVVNEQLNNLLTFSQKHKSIGQAFTFGTIGTLGALAAGTGYYGWQALKKAREIGTPGAMGMFGQYSGLFGGIVMGRGLRAAGIASVYVVNANEIALKSNVLSGENMPKWGKVFQFALGGAFAFSLGWAIGSVIDHYLHPKGHNTNPSPNAHTAQSFVPSFPVPDIGKRIKLARELDKYDDNTKLYLLQKKTKEYYEDTPLSKQRLDKIAQDNLFKKYPDLTHSLNMRELFKWSYDHNVQMGGHDDDWWKEEYKRREQSKSDEEKLYLTIITNGSDAKVFKGTHTSALTGKELPTNRGRLGFPEYQWGGF